MVDMRKTKRQPFRNTIKRVKEKEKSLAKDRAELLSIKKEAQLYTANARQESLRVREVLNKAHQQEIRAEQFEKYAREELHRANKFHPSLGAETYIGSIPVDAQLAMDTALNCRIARPHIMWNDRTQVGAVRLIVGNTRTGRREAVGYSISERAIADTRPEFLKEITEDLGKTIAEELMDRALKLLRK